MAAVTISIEPEELLSLRALTERDGVPNGRQPDVAGVAAMLMRRAPGARPPGPDAAGLSHGIEELSRHGREANLTGG